MSLRGTPEQVERVVTKAPEVAEEVVAGNRSPQDAIREMLREDPADRKEPPFGREQSRGNGRSRKVAEFVVRGRARTEAFDAARNRSGLTNVQAIDKALDLFIEMVDAELQAEGAETVSS